MELGSILIASFCAAIFAAAMTPLFVAPRWAIFPSFLSGFAARFIRDILLAAGLSQLLSILIAAIFAVVLSAGCIRRRAVAPIMVVNGLIPLGAATALLKGIVAVLKISSLKGPELAETSVSAISNLAAGFNTTLCIAVGFWIGMGILNRLRGKMDSAAAGSPS